MFLSFFPLIVKNMWAVFEYVSVSLLVLMSTNMRCYPCMILVSPQKYVFDGHVFFKKYPKRMPINPTIKMYMNEIPPRVLVISRFTSSYKKRKRTKDQQKLRIRISGILRFPVYKKCIISTHQILKHTHFFS